MYIGCVQDCETKVLAYDSGFIPIPSHGKEAPCGEGGDHYEKPDCTMHADHRVSWAASSPGVVGLQPSSQHRHVARRTVPGRLDTTALAGDRSTLTFCGEESC